MKHVFIILITLLTLSTEISAKQDLLTEYQQFKSYPFIEKAYRLEREGNLLDAITEVDKALQVAPEYKTFVDYKLKLELAALPIKQLVLRFLNLSPSQQKESAPSIINALLVREERIPTEQYAVLLTSLKSTDLIKLTKAVFERLVGQERLEDALALINTLDIQDPILLQTRFDLAVQLGDFDSAIKVFPRLNQADFLQNLPFYVSSLIERGEHDKALRTLAQLGVEDEASDVIEFFVQRQIGLSNYDYAEKGLWLLEQRGMLTEQLALQRIEVKLRATNLALKISDITDTNLKCWQKAELIQEHFGKRYQDVSRRLIVECGKADVKSDAYSVVALRVLNAEDLFELIGSQGRPNAKLISGFIQKLIAEERFNMIVDIANGPDFSGVVDNLTLAIAQEEQGMLADAAMTYYHHYLETRSENSLEKATFLWVELKQSFNAKQAIESYILNSEQTIRETLIERYLDTLDDTVIMPTQVVERWFELPNGYVSVAEALRVQDNCRASLSYLDEFELTNFTAKVNRALCLQDLNSSSASQAWQELLDTKPNRDVFIATLHSLMSSGLYLNVLELNEDYPQYQSDSEVKQIKLQALIQSEQHQLALDLWRTSFDSRSADDYVTGVQLALHIGDVSFANTLINQMITKGMITSEEDWALVAQVKALNEEHEEALDAWRFALEKAPQSFRSRTGYAYALAPEYPQKALNEFEILSREMPEFSSEIWKQMAYLSNETGEYGKVSLYLQYYFENLDDQNYFVENQEAWSLHNLYQQSVRRFNFNMSVSHGNGAILGDVFFIDNDGQFSSQLPNNGLSARLTYQVREDSKRTHLYAQVNTSGPNTSPFAQQSIELGVSYRLFENINLLASTGAIYFFDGVDRLQPFLRLSGDSLNQNKWRNGWRVDSSWWERQWFNDVLYLLDNQQIFATSRFDIGYVKPLKFVSKQTLKGYVFGQLDYRKLPELQEQPTQGSPSLEGLSQASVGVGLQWRLFETPQRKDNSASVWSANLEFRQKIGGRLTKDDRGALLTLSYQY